MTLVRGRLTRTLPSLVHKNRSRVIKMLSHMFPLSFSSEAVTALTEKNYYSSGTLFGVLWLFLEKRQSESFNWYLECCPVSRVSVTQLGYSWHLSAVVSISTSEQQRLSAIPERQLLLGPYRRRLYREAILKVKSVFSAWWKRHGWIMFLLIAPVFTGQSEISFEENERTTNLKSIRFLMCLPQSGRAASTLWRFVFNMRQYHQQSKSWAYGARLSPLIRTGTELPPP